MVGVSWVCVCVSVCMCGGGVGCSLIPGGNVEEINLNYKDEASLESGSGRSTEGREGGENSHYCSPSLYIGRHFLFFSFLFFLILWEWGGLPSFLFGLPPRHPSFAHSRIGLLPISRQCSRCWRGQDCRDHSIPTLLLVLSSHRQQMSWFLRERASLCWPLAASETKSKNLFPCLQTCNIPELLANWKEISSCVCSPAHTNELIHTQTQS